MSQPESTLTYSETQSERKFRITYDKFHYFTHLLANKIEDKYKPFDMVIAPSRGGLLAGMILSHRFNVPLIPFRWSTRDFKKQMLPGEIVTALHTKQKVLFVDDINDSGKTIKSLHETINKYHETQIFFSSVYQRYNSQMKCDIVGKEIQFDSWLEFPWEVK